jgi:hypothetical protein
MRLAVLIDADNASPAVIGDVLSEVVSLGVASVKRIYGDFTTPNLAGWRDALLEHAIQPIQQFRNTVGKNATDSALIIDAMDLLHSRELGGFCLVTSDGDFTRLATRIRENGLSVFGFGQEKSPKSLIQSCDRFFYTEILRSKKQPEEKGQASVTSKPLRDLKKDTHLRTAFDQAFEGAANESGRATLSEIGNLIRKRLPDFDVRNYGFGKLSELVEKLPGYRVVRDKTPSGAIIHIERS